MLESVRKVSECKCIGRLGGGRGIWSCFWRVRVWVVGSGVFCLFLVEKIFYEG